MISLERWWYRDSVDARLGRLMLAPFEGSYRAAMALRNWMYDAKLLATHASAVPVFSVGNLSVGGTGKTPIAAHLVSRLLARGARPAIVLRGYGDDETKVHAQLNESAIVVAEPDRVLAVERAKVAGADVVVMDDAFQHRRAGRLVDTVLLDAERFTAHPRLLPAGPWREGLSSLKRASLVIVTRKSAGPERAEQVATDIANCTRAPVAIFALLPDRLVALGNGAEQAVGSLAGKKVLVVAAIANPSVLETQLRDAGMRTTLRSFRDHHAFSGRDAADLALAARGYEAVVCTLKDAVKLGPQWPRSAPPLWYVSQRVVPEQGAEHVDAAIECVLSARH